MRQGPTTALTRAIVGSMAGRLVLIRHAQAQGQHPHGDHERELTDAGVAAGVDLGRQLRDQGLWPDHVAVSTAARARATLAALQDLGEVPVEGAGQVTVWPERRIYSGGVDGVLGAIRESPAGAGTVWVVGHEPVMSTTTWELADQAEMADALRQQLSSGFPTATAAVLEVDAPWADLGLGDARLVALLRGRPG